MGGLLRNAWGEVLHLHHLHLQHLHLLHHHHLHHLHLHLHHLHHLHQVAGMDVAGVVEEVGKDVTSLQVSNECRAGDSVRWGEVQEIQ